MLRCRMHATSHFRSLAAGDAASLPAFVALAMIDCRRDASGCRGGDGRVDMSLSIYGETQGAVKHLLMLRALKTKRKEKKLGMLSTHEGPECDSQTGLVTHACNPNI